jgi:hypothetical protein
MRTQYRDDDAEATRDAHFVEGGEPDVETQDRTMGMASASASQSGDNEPLIPVWMRESAKSFKYKWVPLPLRKAGRATAVWIKGPVPPQELRIKPFFPQIQDLPLRLLDRYLPKQRYRIGLLIAFYAAWFLAWSLMLKHNSTSGYIEGYGQPTNIWCGHSFWFVLALSSFISTLT